MPNIPDNNHSLIVSLHHRATLIVTGEEACDFLNDLLTLNITTIDPYQVMPAALLTPQGRMLFDLLISQTAQGYRLECDSDLMPDLIQKLRLYRMRRQVEITLSDSNVIAAFGTVDGPNWLADTRFSSAGAEYKAWRSYDDTPAQSDAQGTPEHDKWVEAYQASRYQLAIAEGARELPTEKALPLEARLDDLGAISFDKGCFIGQEVTARTRYRGLLKRRYMAIKTAAPFPIPTDIICDGRLVGEVLGLAKDQDGWVGLANIRLDAAESGKPLIAADTTITLLSPQTATIKA
jgi:folate-binding protein YgfZ